MSVVKLLYIIQLASITTFPFNNLRVSDIKTYAHLSIDKNKPKVHYVVLQSQAMGAKSAKSRPSATVHQFSINRGQL